MLETLDLHGFRKEEAIRRVTDFLEQHASASSLSNEKESGARSSNTDDGRGSKNGWVCIVTGSGAHSNEGPVLRTAVHNLLIKRQMDFSALPGKGGFTVNPRSGFTPQPASQPIDSKVVVVPSANDHVKVVRRQAATTSSAIASPATSRNHHPQSKDGEEYFASNPLPRQVAADDALVADIQNKSRLEHAKVQQQQRRQEKSELSQAVSDSKAAYEEERMVRQQEEETCEIALELSAKEAAQHQQQQQNEEDELKKALSLSTRSLQEERQREENMMEEALRLSQLDSLSKQRVTSTDDHDQDLERALELSQRCHQEQRASSPSAAAAKREEELIQQALQLSLQQL